MNRSVTAALLAAALFGASTPLAKLLLGQVPPALLAGLLYLGSGIGLLGFRVVRDRGWRPSGLAREEWPWLVGAILFGGLLGPLALMWGLLATSGAATSLLLNLEAVFTAAIAWIVFRENADRRIVAGMLAIVAGGIVLALPASGAGIASSAGALLVGAACLCWAIDNNLTRKVSATDATFIAGTKGLAAGSANVVLALATGATLPGPLPAASAMSVGFAGYGVSLALFVVALRGLGAARTGAYFSTAPFIGATVSLAMLGDEAGPAFWLAATLMGWGVWLHLTEHHEHEHPHEAMAHRHSHTHDEHHRHDHLPEEESGDTHDHWHSHEPMVHSHPHLPDIHHRHGH